MHPFFFFQVWLCLRKSMSSLEFCGQPLWIYSLCQSLEEVRAGHGQATTSGVLSLRAWAGLFPVCLHQRKCSSLNNLWFLSGICVSMFILVGGGGFLFFAWPNHLQSELKLFKCYSLPRLSLCIRINPLPSFATQALAKKVGLKSRAPSLPGATTPQLESLAARPWLCVYRSPRAFCYTARLGSHRNSS